MDPRCSPIPASYASRGSRHRRVAATLMALLVVVAACQRAPADRLTASRRWHRRPALGKPVLERTGRVR